MVQEQKAEITAVSSTVRALAPLDLEVRLGLCRIEAKICRHRGYLRADPGKYRFDKEAAQAEVDEAAEIDVLADGGSAQRT